MYRTNLLFVALSALIITFYGIQLCELQTVPLCRKMLEKHGGKCSKALLQLSNKDGEVLEALQEISSGDLWGYY